LNALFWSRPASLAPNRWSLTLQYCHPLRCGACGRAAAPCRSAGRPVRDQLLTSFSVSRPSRTPRVLSPLLSSRRPRALAVPVLSPSSHGMFKLFGLGGHKTFKPLKGHRSDGRRALADRAHATLGSGDVRAAVALPPGEDENEWLAVNVVDFYNTASLCVGAQYTPVGGLTFACDPSLAHVAPRHAPPPRSTAWWPRCARPRRAPP
jgi:hypothetical protein